MSKTALGALFTMVAMLCFASMDAMSKFLRQRGLKFVLAQQCLCDLDRRRGGHRLAVGRIDAEGMGAVGQVDRLHISDLLRAEAKKGFVREGNVGIVDLVVFHHTPPQREPERRAVISIVLSARPASLPASMRIVRMRGSAIGRRRSISSRPLSSRAPVTSIPSASMKARWN